MKTQPTFVGFLFIPLLVAGFSPARELQRNPYPRFEKIFRCSRKLSAQSGEKSSSKKAGSFPLGSFFGLSPSPEEVAGKKLLERARSGMESSDTALKQVLALFEGGALQEADAMRYYEQLKIAEAAARTESIARELERSKATQDTTAFAGSIGLLTAGKA